jgi:hypothetical protein
MFSVKIVSQKPLCPKNQKVSNLTFDNLHDLTTIPRLMFDEYIDDTLENTLCAVPEYVTNPK